MTHRVLSWDHREQMDLQQLAAAIAAVSGGGIYVREADTGDDQYAIVISDRPYSKTEAGEAYRASWADDT